MSAHARGPEAHAGGPGNAPLRSQGAGALRRLVVLPIVAYRRWISPLKPAPSCRFHPTCSAYAQDAILTHGVLRGGWLAIRRVAKCHPWHPGGLDPVPPPGTPASTPRSAPARSELPEES